jgi:hypothetical protein
VGLVVTLLGAAIGTALVAPAAHGAVWFAAALSYGLQLAAFAAMLALRRDPQLFLIGWAAGMVLRFGALGAVAFWLSRTEALPRDVTLISLVTFVVLLLFLEPLFLKQGRA